MEHRQKSFLKRFSDDFEQKKKFFFGTNFFFFGLSHFLGQKTKIFIIEVRALIFGPSR